jgi:hypothetical protein
MDPVTIAATAAAVMRYALPAIRDFGEKVLDTSEDSASDAVVGFGKKLLITLLTRRPRADKTRPDLMQLEAGVARRVLAVAQDPSQQKAVSQLEGAVEDLLLADPALYASVVAMLQRAPSETFRQGDRSVHIDGPNYGMNITGSVTGNPIINNNNFGQPGVSKDQHFTTGQKYLHLRLPAQALEEFTLATDTDSTNPDVYFLSAVATLNGEKAFLAPLAGIRRAQQLLEAATRLQDRGIFHYFMAYLVTDYYERKSLRAPVSASAAFSRALRLGVGQDEVIDLFHMLGVDNPLPMPQ